MVRQKEYENLLLRFAAESNTTFDILKAFTDQALRSANIKLSSLTIEQITKILATLISSLELAVDVADGNYTFRDEELEIIRSIADNCRGVDGGKDSSKR